MKKAIFNWSGGKDSAFALHEVLHRKLADVYELVTTINRDQNRISMHGVRESLLDLQAKSIGLPLRKVMLPENPSMDIYNQLMRNMLLGFKQEGVNFSVFGDIFLEDLRTYRDEKLAEVGIEGMYPIWKIDTDKIIKRFIELGFRAVVVCVSSQHLDSSFLGRIIDEQFINDLPANVDVCGENGEFHSFVFDGPIFDFPIPFERGTKLFKEYHTQDESGTKVDSGFWYQDLLPQGRD